MSQSTTVEDLRQQSASENKRVPAHKRGARRTKKTNATGLTLERRFTTPGQDPLANIAWEHRSSSITNPDGSVVFKLDNIEVPAFWSQLATDIVVSKYFRKSGLYGKKEIGETSVAQVVERLALTIREAGDRLGGYFASKADADTFQAELSYLLVNQVGAFNSPVWFNCGLWHRYQIQGSGGNYAWDPGTDSIVETDNAYQHPQCSACFIQSVGDDLMSIYELVRTEARLFKYGSGTGTNFSALRGRLEKLSGGGTSSGLMSFLEVFDRAAGATKSGGTTRRAAKMVTLDMDHPEIVDFIEWKVREERKARALIAQGYDADFNGEAYHTISGQNSNNSLRITDAFMSAVVTGSTWETRARTTGEVVERLDARELWNKVADAAWACADPGVQFDTTINRWHTCPNTARINASNPCSEYMFVDNSACNLASLNLAKFLREDGSFDVDGYRHAARVFFMAQDILVDFSSYPTAEIAGNSHRFRPLGLGYANLGTLLMLKGMPYDSDEGRALAASLTAIMTGEAYATSAEIARAKGTFEAFQENREPMLRVMGMHRDAAYALDRSLCPEPLWRAACEVWDAALDGGEQYGYRNAQATVLAPTGTIGLLMDCDTTGIEPDFALVKFKKLAGGGYFKIVNQAVPGALRELGYSDAQAKDIVAYVSGTNTLARAPHINRASLKKRGLDDDDLSNIEKKLPSVFDLSQAFAPWVIGEATLRRLNASSKASSPGFSLLEHLGFTSDEISEANDTIVGRMTIEGAPHLRRVHYPVFDCANRCGSTGKRFLSAKAHLRMMAAAQPFLSGAISKTVNVPNESTPQDIKALYKEGWRLGLKAVAIYRDGCKASQPLSSSNEKEEKTTDKQVDEAGETTVVAEALAGPVRAPGVRVRLPKKRSGFTQEARVGGHKIFLRTGEYSDGTLGEIFIDMHKEGAAFRSVMNCLSMSISIGLQYGVPLDTYVDQFTFTRFEPQGMVEGHPNVKFSTSIVDYIFRVVGIEYLHRYDLAHVPPADTQGIQDPTETKSQEPLTLPPASEQAALPLQASPTRFVSEGIGNPQNQQLVRMMGDAPLCDSCGHITVRNGTCYKCLNCGNSMGCS
jgi:ribonucleoside-diphosphate reductase alpha chain